MDYRPTSMMVLLLLGCGPVVGVSNGGDDRGGGDSGEDEGAQDGTGTSETAATAADTSDSGQDDTTGPTTPLFCGADDPLAPVAVIVGDDDARVLRADGSLVELALPVVPLGEDMSVYTQVAARGDLVAVSRTWYAFFEGPQYDSELALVTATGELSWTLAEPGAIVSTPYLGADASIVATRSLIDGATTGVRYGDGQLVATLSDFYPTGAARDDDGAVPGQRTSNPEPRVSWFTGGEPPIVDATHTAPVGWRARPDGSFLYLAQGEGVPLLVDERPGNAEVIALTELAGIDVATLRFELSPSFAWMLIDAPELDATWRVAVPDGTAEAIDPTPPDGRTLVQCYGPRAVIDDAGAILVASRDATAAQVQRLDPDLGTWEPLGDPVTLIDDLRVTVHGDTYMVRSEGEATTSCPPLPFEPGTATLAGTTLQILRPSDDFAKVVPIAMQYAVPSPDGSCVALNGPTTTTLVDPREDLELEIEGPVTVTWWTP